LDCPRAACYARITDEVWPDPPKYSCLQADEGRICGNEHAVEINGKRFPLGMGSHSTALSSVLLGNPIPSRNLDTQPDHIYTYWHRYKVDPMAVRFTHP